MFKKIIFYQIVPLLISPSTPQHKNLDHQWQFGACFPVVCKLPAIDLLWRALAGSLAFQHLPHLPTSAPLSLLLSPPPFPHHHCCSRQNFFFDCGFYVWWKGRICSSFEFWNFNWIWLGGGFEGILELEGNFGIKWRFLENR